jgi:glycosyltransferase involved in cell wall biosynthesis
MRLLIIGHTAHYLRDDKIVGWGPTIKEVNWLARAFDNLTHLACFYHSPAPNSALPYDTDKVNFVPLPPAGGLTLRDKLRVLLVAPKYISTIIKNISEADVIQVRSPGGLALYAMVILGLTRRKLRWTKYAGNWNEKGKMPPSFAFQRWWLKNGFTHGPVTVNGQWPDSSEHIYPFVNPSLTLKDVEFARTSSQDKQISQPVRLIFVGRVESAKGIGACFDILDNLRQLMDVHLDILGDGPERNEFEVLSRSLNLSQHVTFHGWVPHGQVKNYLADSHFILLPSSASEGWPKVLSEAMAYGVIPVASNISAIPQILEETQAGFALPATNVDQFSNTIFKTVHDPLRWKEMSLAGIKASQIFTYERYIIELDRMFVSFYGTSPFDQDVVNEIQQQVGIFDSN